ncbi:aspartate aminotransferase family protein [Chachezhania sediminis]|uniref:aspartate aminotransferase family protein n=1 Tax=Chachezhania sediminis TaxID=2599291 RepID=UPI00131AF142|nr:aspartate aminotransferase family protein [Chachezhania sediminis]
MTDTSRSILEMNAYSGGTETSPLLLRRQANMGPAAILFYREPLELQRASGAWLEATDGTRYLDCYNNVPSVGHCHPRVVEAVSRQIGLLNVHSRYLTEIVESYLERLLATFPEHLAHAVLTCSGSEANDLAMRMAIRATGNRGFIVTEAAYHGNTAAVADVSPSSWKSGHVPDHVRLVPAPSADAYGPSVAEGFAAAVANAARDLGEAGYGLAAFICDSVFSSDGIHADPEGFLAPAIDAVHAAGGLYIADEVQPGFGRLGHGMWGFTRHGVAPDIVTMGKPMGNGFPMAGLVGRHELFAQFCEDTGYFNTFGGNPVAAAAGMAVLDCIGEEDLIGNAARSGRLLMEGLTSIAAENNRIRALRGTGLFIGIELAKTDVPAGEGVARLIDALRQRQVLIGAAGRTGETLKLRPPLCLSASEVDFFLDALRLALREA